MNSKEYFNGDELAASVWEGKYAAEGESNPDDMHKRMAKEFARIDEKYQKKELNFPKEGLSKYGYIRNSLGITSIYELFKDFKYIVPQGSIMSMLGVDKIGSLSNCFVIGQPEDSYGGILQKDEQLVQLMKRRGGVGIDISTLRPSGTNVTNAAKTSTGAASFMERFSNSTREVAQGGRRGALMITIDVRHPDVFDFVNIKKDRTKVTGANISVMLRDDFMEAVKNDENYWLRFPCDMSDEDVNMDYGKPLNTLIPCVRLDNDEVISYTKRIKAKELYDAIVENAWENAEPGQMFIDKHWNYSPDGAYEQYRGVTTNPCGEIFMQPYDACRLMAINLLSFVEKPYTDEACVDWVKLYQVAYEQQRLADDLVDLELEHISRILAKIHSDEESDEVKRTEIELWEKVYDVASAGRRTGCGFTALGDMLAAVGVAYDSEQGCDYIEKVMSTKMEAELDCTIDLAILRGPFVGWDPEKEFRPDKERQQYKYATPDGKTGYAYHTSGTNKFYHMLVKEFPHHVDRMIKYGRRNVSWSTVAPTGSVSILTQTTSGLEPLFAPYYMRRKKVNPGEEGVRVDFVDQNGDNWMEYPILHPQFDKWHQLNGNHGRLAEFDETTVKMWFEKSPWYNSCAPDIDWKKRVDVQAIIQKYTSHSISSTINLPNDVTKEEVAEIYIHSYDKGLKGVTVYRDGCRTGVLVTDSTKSNDEFSYHDAPKRPKCLPVEIYTVVSKGIKWNVIVGLFNGKPYEVFATQHFTNETDLELCKIKKGRYDLLKDGNVYSEDITSEITDEQDVLTRMVSTALRHGADITYIVEQLNKSNGDITSFSKAIARTLKKYVNEEKMVSRATCTECGSNNLVFEEGCLSCKECGSSKCG
jgi:ribonucleoside-diphosphate reductase alpha chain